MKETVYEWGDVPRAACGTFDEGLKEAEKYGLRAEYVEGFWKYRTAGKSEAEAVWGALYDWDI